METIKLKNIDFELSRVALGTWAIGGWMWGGADDVSSVKTIHAALEKGINIIDTAPVYGFGHSENIVGKAVKEFGGRDKIAIATKAGLEWDENYKINRNSKPQRLIREVEDSLRRLKTDYIDIYQIHWPDESVAFEVTADTLMKLRQQGKIRVIGTSNYQPEHMEQFLKAGELQTNQPPYNIFEREIENLVLPYMKEKGIAALTYGALCRGLLSGKMAPDHEFTGDDLRRHDPKFKGENFTKYLKAVNELDKFAKEYFNKNVMALSVRYILDKGIEIALWGGRKPEQMNAVDDIWGWKLSEADLNQIDNIVDSIVGEPVGPEFMAPKRNV